MSSDQRGFTLVELLVSMVIGMLVLGALFSLVTASGSATKRTSDRVDAAQRGRSAMESSIQELRASVCLPGTETRPGDLRPFLAASPTSVTWYSNLDGDPQTDRDGDGDPTFDPEQRRLTYLPATATEPSQLLEERWVGTTLPVPAGASPTASRVLLTHLDPVSGSGPFTYGAYSDAAGTTLEPFVPGDLARIVRVDVAFIARPTSGSDRERSTSTPLRSSAYARVVNRNTSPLVPLPTYGCTT